MSTNRKSKPVADPTIFVSFRAPKSLHERYREAVAGDERTVSQALRHHMVETVERAKEPQAA